MFDVYSVQSIYASFDLYSYLTVAFPDRTALEVSFIGSMQSGIINMLGLVLPLIIQKIGYRGTMHIGTVSESFFEEILEFVGLFIYFILV